jgi:DNA invertase Pin-like site-specific DNA recombinase
MHLCDEPRCSNLDHLRVGSYSDNMQDCSAKGRLGGNVHGPGEAHGLAKLTDDDVRTIRRLASDGVTQTDLAGRFGVTQPQVSRIVNRRLWRHID